MTLQAQAFPDKKPLDALFDTLLANGGSVPIVYFHHAELGRDRAAQDAHAWGAERLSLETSLTTSAVCRSEALSAASACEITPQQTPSSSTTIMMSLAFIDLSLLRLGHGAGRGGALAPTRLRPGSAGAAAWPGA